MFPRFFIQWQYDHVVKCINGLEDVARLRRYKKFRPLGAVSEDPRAWWLYAVCCHFPDRQPTFCQPKPTWEASLERARSNVQYVKLYTKILTTPTLALTLESKKIKDCVEWERNYEELKALREVIPELQQRLLLTTLFADCAKICAEAQPNHQPGPSVRPWDLV